VTAAIAPPASEAFPSKVGNSRRTAPVNSSSVNQMKLSKTTGALVSFFASSTSKVTVPSSPFVR
jgi:hypothetical protein